jgi:glycosyltransferase involved in cell wall biosynthesis
VKAKKVILAAETEGMKKELEEFTKLPIELFPHPIEAQNPSRNTRALSDPITVSCPGFARHEKGSDLLLSAMERLNSEGTLDRFHFILQWPEPFLLPDGTKLKPDKEFENSDNITFYNESLDAEAYNTWLSQTDFVILPYRKSSYYNRLSRVAIEAGARGIPLIYTDGTWTEEVAALVECGVKIDGESPAELVKALNHAYEDAKKFKDRAAAGAERVKQYHSCENFRSIMLQHSSTD